MNLTGKKIFITGGKGFLGQHLLGRFTEEGAEVFILGRDQCDLRDKPSVDRAFAKLQPDIVVHAAGFLGGVHFSRLYPAEVFLNNLQIGCNILEMSQKHKVKKLVNIGSACVYSDLLAGPFQEEEMMKARMHPSVQYYGFSKLALYLGGKAFKEQYGLTSIHLVLANLYGPGDKFDPELSHVVSSMIPRFYEAARKNLAEVVCWGTGKTIREFLYVEDCAEAIVLATKLHEEVEPLNVGVGEGITIKELAETIQEVTGFKGRIVWDTAVPDGAGYKVVDTAKMKSLLGWESTTSFEIGLQKTVDWFDQHYEEWLTRRKHE